MGQVPSHNYKKITNDDDGGGSENKKRRWSDLPDVVLHTIAMKLSSVPTYVAYGRTCQAWRSVYKEAMTDFMASLPPLLIADKKGLFHTDYIFYDITERRHLKLLKSPMLKTSLYLSRSADHYVFYSRKELIKIVPYVTHMHTGRLMDRVRGFRRPFNMGVFCVLPGCTKFRLILFDEYGAFHLQMEIGGTAEPVALTQHDWTYCSWLSYTNPPFTNRFFYRVMHAIVIKNTLYTVSLFHYFYFMQLVGPGPLKVHKFGLKSEQQSAGRIRLGDWDGELVVLSDRQRHHKGPGSRFVVMRLDMAAREWVRMESLNGRMLFASANGGCQLLDGARVKGIMRDCIYVPSEELNTFEVYTLDGARVEADFAVFPHYLNAATSWFFPKPSMINDV